ncbi:MAG: hypothetical protein QME52_10765 [Bacteroidota bacterium]|nr:hypothetical protein [Bacteroidota bacterium]
MADDNKLDGQIEVLNKRIDTMTIEVVDLKKEVREQGELLKAMGHLHEELFRSIINLKSSLTELVNRFPKN